MNPNMRLKIHKLLAPACIATGLFAIIAMSIMSALLDDAREENKALTKTNEALYRQVVRALEQTHRAHLEADPAPAN